MKKGFTASFLIKIIIGVILLVILWTFVIEPSLKVFSSRMDEPSYTVFKGLVDVAKDRDTSGPEKRVYQMREGYTIVAFNADEVRKDSNLEYVSNSVPQCKEGNCLCLCFGGCQNKIYKCEVFWYEEFKTYNKPLLQGTGKLSSYVLEIKEGQGKRVIDIRLG